MPACYDNLFAFRAPHDCGTPIVPTSGLYIDDEAVSLASVSQTGKHTYQDAQQALNAKTQLAFYKTRTQLQSELMRHGFIFKQGGEPPKSCLCATSCARGCGNLSGAQSWSGEKPKNSPYSAITVDKIEFVPQADNIALVVEIRDAGGIALWATVVNAQTGIKQTILVGEKFEVSIFIAIPDACNLQVSALVKCDITAILCDYIEELTPYLLHEVRAQLLSDMLVFSQPTVYTGGYIASDPLEKARNYQTKESEKALRAAMSAIVGSMRKRDDYCVSCSPSSPRIRPL